MANYSQAQQQATLQGTTGAIGAQGDSTSGHGYNAGALRVYTGSAPATAHLAETGTKLVDQALPNPFVGAPSAAEPSVLTANAISDSTILATGTAGYARLVTNTSTGVPVAETGANDATQRRIQLSVATSGAEVNLNTTSLVSGGTFSTTSFAITHG